MHTTTLELTKLTNQFMMQRAHATHDAIVKHAQWHVHHVQLLGKRLGNDFKLIQNRVDHDVIRLEFYLRVCGTVDTKDAAGKGRPINDPSTGWISRWRVLVQQNSETNQRRLSSIVHAAHATQRVLHA
jgi:hypothetical protein